MSSIQNSGTEFQSCRIIVTYLLIIIRRMDRRNNELMQYLQC